MVPITTVVTFLLGVVCSVVLWVVEICVTHTTELVWAAACGSIGWALFRYVFALKITLHPATSKVFADMVLMFQEETMYCESAVPVQMVGNEIDVDLTHEPSRPDIKLVRSKRRISYAVRVAHLAKAQVGLLSNIKANELVYARICREEMIKHGLRPSHIAHTVPLAVAACFIPLDADFLAASLRRCPEMAERGALLGHPTGK